MPEYNVYMQGGTGEGWHLSVQEDESNVVVLDVTLSAAEAWKIQTGGGIHATAFIAPETGLSRLGKKMRNWSRSIPYEICGYGEITPEIRQWAVDAETEPFDVVDVHRTNFGAEAVYRIWDDVDAV